MDQSEMIESTSNIKAKPELLALLLSLLPSLFCCVNFVLFFGFAEEFHYGPAGLAALCFSVLGIISSLIGIIVGGRALAVGKGQKTVAVAAVVLGILSIIATGIVLAITFTVCCIPI